jgi:hypothetical protein
MESTDITPEAEVIDVEEHKETVQGPGDTFFIVGARMHVPDLKYLDGIPRDDFWVFSSPRLQYEHLMDHGRFSFETTKELKREGGSQFRFRNWTKLDPRRRQPEFVQFSPQKEKHYRIGRVLIGRGRDASEFLSPWRSGNIFSKNSEEIDQLPPRTLS